jgi:hypothetical protein
VSSNFVQGNLQEVNYKFTLGETCAPPKHRPSSSTVTMVTPEKEANNRHT